VPFPDRCKKNINARINKNSVTNLVFNVLPLQISAEALKDPHLTRELGTFLGSNVPFIGCLGTAINIMMKFDCDYSVMHIN
jgi:hypothetical protein